MTDDPDLDDPELAAIVDAYAYGRITRDDYLRRRRLLEQERRYGPRRWRPARRMPSLKQVAEHLGIADMPPHCWKCGDLADATSWSERCSGLERAHVIDRVYGGLDNAANLRPLCATCHRYQPIFKNGDEEVALAWFNDHRSAVAGEVDRVLAELDR
jgi:5-methylcytosine-specific restriction endonuclease McrA